MHVYVYRADLYCRDCGQELCDSILKPVYADLEDEATWDSDDYPKGPYSNGGGESEYPQHCAGCGVSLDNPVILSPAELRSRLLQRT